MPLATPLSVATLSSNEVRPNTKDLANGYSISCDGVDETEETLKFTSTSYPSNCLRFLHDGSLSEAVDDGITTKAKTSLDVLIVGAGLGGLATAVALRRRGHAVTVFEQAPELMEVRRDARPRNKVGLSFIVDHTLTHSRLEQVFKYLRTPGGSWNNGV